MQQRGGFSPAQLDELVITIELTLVSLAQSLALQTLASSSLAPILHLDYQYWPYILSGVVLILFFWTQAISHALTFIEWPLNLAHNIIYFVAMLAEVLLFTQVTDPLHWYAFNAAFFVVGAVFYWVDLHMIYARKDDFERAKKGHLYQELVHDQRLALRALIPFGFFLSLAAVVAISAFPEQLIANKGHVWFGALQAVVGLIVLIRSIRDFRHHSSLLTE
jgi:hypothetical protein